MIEEFTAKTNMKLFVLEYDWMASCSRQPTLIYVNSQKKKSNQMAMLRLLNSIITMINGTFESE